MNTQEQIIAYLDGSMTPEECTAFEAALKVDPQLAEETAQMRNVLKGIELYGENQLREQLREVTRQPFNNGMVAWKRMLWAAAAAVLLLLAATIWWWRPNPSDDIIVTAPPPVSLPDTTLKSPSPTATPPASPVVASEVLSARRAGALLALAGNHYQSPTFTQLRSTQKVDSAALLMNRRAWQDAIQWINRHPATGDDRLTQEVMLAHAWMGLKRYDKARPMLEKVVKSNVMPWSEESQYYLLLCYVARWESDSSAYLSQKTLLLKQKEHPDYERVKALDAAVRKQINATSRGNQ